MRSRNMAWMLSLGVCGALVVSGCAIPIDEMTTRSDDQPVAGGSDEALASEETTSLQDGTAEKPIAEDETIAEDEDVAAAAQPFFRGGGGFRGGWVGGWRGGGWRGGWGGGWGGASLCPNGYGGWVPCAPGVW